MVLKIVLIKHGSVGFFLRRKHTKKLEKRISHTSKKYMYLSMVGTQNRINKTRKCRFFSFVENIQKNWKNAYPHVKSNNSLNSGGGKITH
jgi:hypothetical protein